MGGSVIGLFGNFGDGWYEAGYGFEYKEEGDRDSGLWGHLKVGDVIRDTDYLGVESVAKFNNQNHLKPMKFQINGFGKEIKSINGSILTKGEQNQTVRFSDIRKIASRGGSISSTGEMTVKVEVNRVPAMFDTESNDSKGVSISNEEVCTVAFKTVSSGGRENYDLFYIFSSVEVKDNKVKNGVLQGRRVGKRKDTCNRLWTLYKNERTDEGFAKNNGMIYLHQRKIEANKNDAVYVIGNQTSLYLWEVGNKNEAIALSGIIWSGKNYAKKEGGDNGCKEKQGDQRIGCYKKIGSKKVHSHLGWNGVKGRDFEAITLNSVPGDRGWGEFETNRDLSHSGHCDEHKVCINYPWQKEIKIELIKR